MVCAQNSCIGVEGYDRKSAGPLSVVKIDSRAGQFLRVVDVIVSFFLILDQIGDIFDEFLGINARINSEVFPTTNTIGNCQNILGDEYCILAAFVNFLGMGTYGAAVYELVEFVMSGLYFEGDSLFGFGSVGVLVHDVLI